MEITSPQNPEGIGQSSVDSGVRIISLEHFWRVLIRRRLIVILFTLACLGGGFLYVSTAKRIYSSAATLDINQHNSQGNFSELIQSPFDMEQNTRMQTEERFMQSATVLLQVADKLDLIHKPQYSFPNIPTVAQLTPEQKNDLVNALRHNISFSVLPGTTIVSVACTSTSPTLARDIPNALIEVYVGQHLGSGQIGTKAVSDWLQAQTNDLRKQVEDSSRKLAEFQRLHNIIGVDESQNMLVDKLRVLNEQLATAQVDRITKETNYRVSQTGNVELMGNLGLDPQLQGLRAQQTQLQAEYNALSTRYGQGYPRIQELTKQLTLLQAQIDSEVKRLQAHYLQEYQAATQNESRFSAAAKEQETAVFNLDERAAEYAILRHNAESTRTLYDEIEMKLKESGIIDTLKSTSFRIVDEAALPTVPIAPRKQFTVVVSLLLGFLGGCVLALIVDSIDDAIFSGEELERRTGLPILGVTPHLSIGDLFKTGAPSAPGVSSQLISLNDARSGALESFRGLRSSMLLGFGDLSPKLQVITSTSQGEGKSFIASNYSRVLAQTGSRVLLIDADLRRGSLHNKFAIPAVPGLTTLLSDRSAKSAFVVPEPELPTLFVLPRGPIPPNPTDLLSSSRFLELVEEWCKEFDYVIIDSAPILPVTDTLAIAQRADVVFLVVRIGVTSSKQFMRIRQRLQRLNVPVKGIILNDVTKASAEYNYYYGGYKYGEDDNANTH